MNVPPFLLAAALLFTSVSGWAVERVPLVMDWPGTDSVPGGFPVFCGLSLPRGMVRETAEIHLEDSAGNIIPAEVEPMAQWTPGPSLKWAGLHFLAERGVRYFAVIGPKAERLQAQIHATQMGQKIHIQTGTMRLELPESGQLFGSVLGGSGPAPFIQGYGYSRKGDGRLIVKDSAGRIADETQAEPNAPRQQTIELKGTQSVVIRREGHLLTKKGECLGRYVVRLQFYAGSNLMKMQHTFINTENTNELQYADLGINFPMITGDPNHPRLWEVAVEPSPNAAPVEFRLNAITDAAYMLQADFAHHGQKTNRRELMIKQGTKEFMPVNDAARSQDGAAGNWAVVQAPFGGVLVALPNLAQLFPKELEISSEGLTAHLWSSRGRRLLDYRPATLVDHWGTAWMDKAWPGGSEAMRKIQANAQGTSRTHDLWIAFLPPGPATAAAPLGRLCANPPTCIQDPAWMRKTEALGYIHPYDPEHFPALEKFIHHFVQEYLVQQAERWGDYGFLDFGCGPHSYQNTVALPGEEPPRMYRYSDMMYNGQTALWLAYARSGDRMYRDYTQDFHRHLADFKFAHAPGPNRSEGSRIGGGISEESCIYWSGEEDRFGGGMLNGHQGFDAEGFLLQRYLTGDRWGEECIVKSGESMLAGFKPEVLPEIGASSDGAQPFITAAALYQHTGDPRYLGFLSKVRARMINLQTITGGADPNYYGAWEKYPIKAAGVLADFLATDAPLSREALEKAFRIMLWDAPGTTTGYQDKDGRFANHAWRMFGNPRYASLIEERLNRVLFEYMDADGKFRTVTGAAGGPHHGGTHGFNFLETAFYGMDLLTATEGQRKPYLAIDTGPRNQPVAIYFAKDWHEPLDFELRHEGRADLEVSSSSHERGRPGRSSEYGFVHWDDYPLYYTPSTPGFSSGYARLEMGAETVGGEYCLKNVPLIFTHNAHKLVMAAPDGVILRAIQARPPTWYFQIPAGKKGAIYANKPMTLRRGGQPLPTTPGEWTELEGGATDELVSLETSGLVFVNFRGGIPPVLAAHDPQLFFVPKAVQEMMTAREQAPPPVRSTELYQPGFDGQALLLTPGRTLRIPRGAKIAPRQFQYVHYDEGTLEFRFRPRWSTGSATKSSSLNFLMGAFWPCWIRHSAGDDQDPRSASAFGIATPGGPTFPLQQLINPSVVREGQWHHFAMSWTTDPERGWLSELYIDGQPSLPWARFQTGLGRFLEAEAPKTMPKPWAIGEPEGEMITLLGHALDASLDELRISRKARYPKGFSPLPERRFEMDADTLLLLRFDGHGRPELPDGAPMPEVNIGN